jgi:hypothetical protein
MQRTILLIPALVCLGYAGCRHGTPETVPPLQHVDETTSIPTDGTAAGLTGDWELRSNPPQRPPGFSLTVTVDSVVDAQYFGRLTHYFSGDVGRDPREFEAFRDTLRPDGTVRFDIPTVDRELLGIVLEGLATADTMRLSLFVLGPDTLSNGTRRWTLVRRH